MAAAWDAGHPLGWEADAVTSPRDRTAVVLGEGTVCVGRSPTVNILPVGGGQHGGAGPRLLQGLAGEPDPGQVGLVQTQTDHWLRVQRSGLDLIRLNSAVFRSHPSSSVG